MQLLFCFIILCELFFCHQVFAWQFSWKANVEPVDFYEVCWGITPNLELNCESTDDILIDLPENIFDETTRYFFGVRACCSNDGEYGDFSKTATTIDVYPRTIVGAESDYDGDGIIDRGFRTQNYYLMIDYSGSPPPEQGFNHPGTWDIILAKYGGVTAHMIAMDYDQGGKDDVVYIKSSGTLAVDLSENGLGDMDVEIDNYFDCNDSEYVAYATDHDGDNVPDISINTKDWRHFIDYSYDGYGNLIELPSIYGGQLATFTPLDYDKDGLSDIGIITGNGTLYVDCAANGFGGYDFEIPNYVPSDEYPVDIRLTLADYDKDHLLDLSIMETNFSYYVDYSNDGYGNPVQLPGEYGGAKAMPIVVDEDMDKVPDIGILKGNGEVQVDFAANGFNGLEKTLQFY